MFSGITDFIFGRSPDCGEAQPQKPSERSSDPQLMTSSTEDSDWLFVDRSDFDFSEESSETLQLHSESIDQSQSVMISSNSTPSKSDSSTASGSEETSDFERFRGPFLSMHEVDPQSDAALSDVSSQPEHVAHPSLEECWIVTPPPCFTASGFNSDVIQTHPLENLLIEHPSMSVYWPQDRLNLDPDDDSIVGTDEVLSQGQNHEAETLEVSETSYRRQERYLDVNHLFDLDLSEISIFQPHPLLRRYRPMYTAPEGGRLMENQPDNLELLICRSRSVDEEKGRKWSTNQNNTRKFLYQQNLVHDHSSRGKIRSRKDRMILPSGRSNNRKC